jgi:hypothetical protein
MKKLASAILFYVLVLPAFAERAKPTAPAVPYLGAAATPWQCRDQVRAPLFLEITERQSMEYLVHLVAPEPPDNIDLTQKQTVYVQLMFDTQGFVVCARPLDLEGASMDASLRARSVEAVKQWRFKTLYRKMKPVVATTVVAFEFHP